MVNIKQGKKQQVSQIYVPRVIGPGGGNIGNMGSPRRVEAGNIGAIHQPESCCGCCGCGDTFLTSPTGFTKLAELAISVVCQFLMLHYGVE